VRSVFSLYDWNLWVFWMMTTASGTTASGLLLGIVVTLLRIPTLSSTSEGAADPSIGLQLLVSPLFLLVGAVIGLGQWTVLRTIILRASRWIWATALAWFAGYVLVTLFIPLVTSYLEPAEVALLPGFFFGSSTGIAQWLLLRRQFTDTGWWVTANALAGVIGTTGGIFAGICGGFLGWMVGAGITGFLLLRYMNRPHLKSG